MPARHPAARRFPARHLKAFSRTRRSNRPQRALTPEYRVRQSRQNRVDCCPARSSWCFHQTRSLLSMKKCKSSSGRTRLPVRQSDLTRLMAVRANRHTRRRSSGLAQYLKCKQTGIVPHERVQLLPPTIRNVLDKRWQGDVCALSGERVHKSSAFRSNGLNFSRSGLIEDRAQAGAGDFATAR